MTNKDDLYLRGCLLLNSFCALNQIPAPEIQRLGREDRLYSLATCAYYRAGRISVMVEKCAHIGSSGMAWSYPGYKVDRTPYGVLQHELGHHIDRFFSQQFGLPFSEHIYTKEPHLTGYRGSGGEYNKTHFHMEWFAEHFRLFVTNPGLSQALAPVFNARLRSLLWPVELRPPLTILLGAPERTRRMAERLLGEKQ